MTDRRYDPVGVEEIWRAKYNEAVRAFRAGEFPYTESVFRATLFGLGFTPRSIDSEVALIKMDLQ